MVSLEANSYQFPSGEQIQLAIESERSGYLYVFDVDAETKVTQLFPNQFEKDNALAAAHAGEGAGSAGAISVHGRHTVRHEHDCGARHTREVGRVTRSLSLPTSLSPLNAAQEGDLRDALRGLAASGTGSSTEWAYQKMTVEVVDSRVDRR